MQTKPYRIWLAPIVVLLMVLSFAAGAGIMYSTSHHSILGLTAQVAQVMPGVMEVETAADIPAATDLRPLATFWQVRDRILHDYVYPIEDDTKLTYGAIRGMLASLEDPYSRFMTPGEYEEFQEEAQGKFEGIGAWLEQRHVTDTTMPVECPTCHHHFTIPVDDREGIEVAIVSIIPEGPAATVDLRPGDVLLKVDDKSVRGMHVAQVSKLIRGPEGTPVKLSLRREGQSEIVELTIIRAAVDIPTIETRIVEDNIGYVWLRGFHKQAETKLREALEEMVDRQVSGLIFDLSLNGGGLLEQAISVSNLFLDNQTVVYVQERNGDAHPYRTMPGRVVSEDLPVVVLIDGGSASASEIVAAALHDTGRAQVVGQHSFCKSKVQTVMELTDHSALVLSTAVYLTPDKRDLSEEYADGKRGVEPDIVFPLPELDEEFGRKKWEQWHDQQIQQAAKVLLETLPTTGKAHLSGS